MSAIPKGGWEQRAQSSVGYIPERFISYRFCAGLRASLGEEPESFSATGLCRPTRKLTSSATGFVRVYAKGQVGNPRVSRLQVLCGLTTCGIIHGHERTRAIHQDSPEHPGEELRRHEGRRDHGEDVYHLLQTVFGTGGGAGRRRRGKGSVSGGDGAPFSWARGVLLRNLNHAINLGLQRKRRQK